MGKKEFAAAILDLEYETFIVYVASPSSTPFDVDVHPSRKSQIASLIAKEAPTKVLAEYADFVDVFFPDLASKLPKYTGINCPPWETLA